MIFFIHDDLFDRILETDQNSDIELKVIHKYLSLPSINDNGTESRSKLRNRSEILSPFHRLQREIQKKVHYCSQKLIDYFKLTIVILSPKLNDQENLNIATSFGYSYQDQSI